MPQNRPRYAFTLVELLVVIAIIGILVSLLLPAVQAAREAGRRAQCTNNMRQIGLAIHNYHDTNKLLPSGSDYTHGMRNTWCKLVLPFVELQTHFDSFDHAQPLYHANNAKAVTLSASVFFCPSDPLFSNPILENRGHTNVDNPGRGIMLNYPVSIGPTHVDQCPFCPDPNPSSGNWCCQGHNFGTRAGAGVGEGNATGMFGRHRKAHPMAAVTDGLSNTFMNGETIPAHYIWNGAFCPNFPVVSMSIPPGLMKESDNGQSTNWWRASGMKSYHPGGMNVAMGDGSVRFVTKTIDHPTYAALGTRSGGEAVQAP
jgi:prepilin-type N-terminal cleavage/methylation domain-containing protein/prepilin-type processing-associated H-X9-DG protein